MLPLGCRSRNFVAVPADFAAMPHADINEFKENRWYGPCAFTALNGRLMAQNPFDTIESTHEYMKLLDEVLDEVQATTEEELKRIVLADTMVISRGVEALHLLSFKIEQLRHHIKASSRILNDLRTMRRLLLRERRGGSDHGTQAAPPRVA